MTLEQIRALAQQQQRQRQVVPIAQPAADPDADLGASDSPFPDLAERFDASWDQLRLAEQDLGHDTE